MVALQKTARGAKSVWSKILTASMIAIGFFALIVNARMRVLGTDFPQGELGIAHADSAACSGSCTNCVCPGSCTDGGPGS